MLHERGAHAAEAGVLGRHWGLGAGQAFGKGAVLVAGTKAVASANVYQMAAWSRHGAAPEKYDYIEHTERALHEACLERQYERVPALVDHLIEQAKKLKKWAAVQ